MYSAASDEHFRFTWSTKSALEILSCIVSYFGDFSLQLYFRLSCLLSGTRLETGLSSFDRSSKSIIIARVPRDGTGRPGMSHLPVSSELGFDLFGGVGPGSVMDINSL